MLATGVCLALDVNVDSEVQLWKRNRMRRKRRRRLCGRSMGKGVNNAIEVSVKRKMRKRRKHCGNSKG